MKDNSRRGTRRPTRQIGVRKNSRFTRNDDPFFEPDAKKRRRGGGGDEVIESEDSGEDIGASGDEAGRSGEENGGEEVEESAADKKLRIAKEQLERIRALTRELDDEGEGAAQDEEDDDHERGGKRDSLVAEILQKEQLEQSGRVQRAVASRIVEPDFHGELRPLFRHKLSVTAVALSDDEKRGFSASKDGAIFHWDVETGAKEKYKWPTSDKNIKDGSKKQSKNVLSLAVSSDGRYLATGGLDRLVHLWDTRTREHLQAFQGHKGPVSCLTFRQGTSELYSGSFDRMIKWWNAEDRCHLNNFFGHQAEILGIDCLRKERILSVGRDRTLRLFKILEESSLRYSTPTSALECCCFINNDEYLSGSDDGSVQLWSLLRRKPSYIFKNAHSVSVPDLSHAKMDDGLPNGIIENGSCKVQRFSAAQSWVSSVAVCKGSDLAASGAGNGFIRLWAIESESRSIRPLYQLPMVGFVNSLAFARSGRFLVAGVGQEPRLGRWSRVPEARNGVTLIPLNLAE